MTPSRSQRHSKHIYLKNHVQVWYYLLFKNLFEKFYNIMHDFPNLLWTSWNCIIKCSDLGRASFFASQLEKLGRPPGFSHILSINIVLHLAITCWCVSLVPWSLFLFWNTMLFLDFHMLSHVVMLGTWVQCLSLWSLCHLQMGVHNWLWEIPLGHSIVKLEIFDFNVGNYKGSIPLQTYWLFTRLRIL